MLFVERFGLFCELTFWERGNGTQDVEVPPELETPCALTPVMSLEHEERMVVGRVVESWFKNQEETLKGLEALQDFGKCIE